MKPGGYVELSESYRMFFFLISEAIPPTRKFSDPHLANFRSDDGSLKDDSPLQKWANLMNDAMIASGRPVPSEALLRERLEKAGFVDVQSFTLRLPVGPWPKDK
jgi:hypothetical protein